MYMKVLMVCLGNICRSPLAHGILDAKIKENNLDWEVDSAGTSNFHQGESPDHRSIEEAFQNGIDISEQNSRPFAHKDLEYYDEILVMDKSNYQHILSMCQSEGQKAKVKLIMDYTYPGEGIEVPDPYYVNGFDVVFEMLDAAIDHMIEIHS